MNPVKTPQPPAAPPPLGERALRADARRNRDAVLVAAYRLFAEHGLDAQIDEIAVAAGVGVGTVYRHFPTKDDLVAALASHRFEKLADAAREALASEDAWQGFSEYLHFAAKLQVDDHALSQVMTSRPEVMRNAAEAAGMFELMEALVQRARDQGGLRADFRGEDVPMVVCGLGRVTQVGHTLPYMRWDRLLGIVLDGLRAPGETPLPD